MFSLSILYVHMHFSLQNMRLSSPAKPYESPPIRFPQFAQTLTSCPLNGVSDATQPLILAAGVCPGSPKSSGREAAEDRQAAEILSGRESWTISMRIRKIGRERPILHRGMFSVPDNVTRRLSVAKTHLIFAQAVGLNAKVDLLYLGVDNALTAAIMAKEKVLTTTSHSRKIEKFFKHYGRQARGRSIDKEDLNWLRSSWERYRYHLELPKWSEMEKMRNLALHTYDVVITEVARSFKSDETILRTKADAGVIVYESEGLGEIAEHFHEVREMEAESYGDEHGGGLSLKLLNEWNYIRATLLSDKKDVIKILDESKDAQAQVKQILESWERLLYLTKKGLLLKLARSIAEEKINRKGAKPEKAAEEAIEAARNHPDLHRFRLYFALSFDSSEPREMLGQWASLLKAAIDSISKPNMIPKQGWEIAKAESKSKSERRAARAPSGPGTANLRLDSASSRH